MSYFDYRTFYTWDHSTNWDLTQPGIRVGGCHELYEKPPQAFMEDYTRLIDYMCQLGLNHVIIWGALRDTHGGAKTLRKLVKYGMTNGVRVAPGVGVNCYGGVYYEGDHEYSLVSLLQKHPELAAVDENGKPMLGDQNPRRSIACPRNKKVIDWTLRSIRWLMEDVGPSAIHFETGDYGVCHCKICKSTGARGKRVSNEDMAEILPPIVAEVRSLETDCWLSYNHYTGYTREMMNNPPAFARQIPGDVICKWGVSWMLAPELTRSPDQGWGATERMSPEVRPPTAVNMAHLHFGTGWWNCSPRGTLEIARFFRSFPLVSKVGFQGICTHGEESSLNPPAELNYHIYAALAENPTASPEDIAKRSVSGLYGDEELAVAILAAFRDEEVPRDLPPEIAKAAAQTTGQAKVRLNWLTFEIQKLAERTRTAR
ncbi:hypothetical protein ACFL6S_02400 [Candidatus Poribacteria bacterium]